MATKLALFTAVTLVSATTSYAHQNHHTLDDIRKEDTPKTRLFRLVPVNLEDIKKATNTELNTFKGKGHRLGGDPYVNRLMGIDHAEGKKLYKLAKTQEKKTKNKRSKKIGTTNLKD